MRSIGRIIAIVAVVGVAILVLYTCASRQFGAFTVPGSGVSIDMNNVIPSTWTVVSGKGLTCDFDADGEQEQLVVYTYDKSPSAPSALFGAVIFDNQVNRAPQEPSTESPSRPALLVPYKLLPDIYTAKGQGYLGESDVQVVTLTDDNKGYCTAKELLVLGAISGSVSDQAPNYLSIFRWGGESTGYVGTHFVGNARIVPTYGTPKAGEASKGATAPVSALTTYSRLNDRSQLCAAQPYRRVGAQELDLYEIAPDFRADELAYTIDFCYGAPDDPYYPEGVVVALLRGSDPSSTNSPTGASYLTPEALLGLPDLLAPLSMPSAQRQPYPILTVMNPGTLAPIPAQGYPCPTANISTPDDRVWWCANEMAQVLTEVMMGGQVRRFQWTLISMADQKTVDDVLWRVDRVEQLQ